MMIIKWRFGYQLSPWLIPNWATWLSAQNNASSRLLKVVQSPDSVVSVSGNVRWRGQMEQFGRDLVSDLREQLNDHVFTAEREQDIRSYLRLLDRQGPFAVGSICVQNVLRSGQCHNKFKRQIFLPCNEPST